MFLEIHSVATAKVMNDIRSHSPNQLSGLAANFKMNELSWPAAKLYDIGLLAFLNDNHDQRAPERRAEERHLVLLCRELLLLHRHKVRPLPRALWPHFQVNDWIVSMCTVVVLW